MTTMLTTKETAERLSYHRVTIYRWLQAGEIPEFCYHQREGGGQYRFSSAAVDFFATRGRWPKHERELTSWRRAMGRSADAA